MAAIKTTTSSPPGSNVPVAPQSFVVSPHGQNIQVKHVAPTGGMPCISIGPTGGANNVVLSQSNIADLITQLTAFATGGLLN